MRTLCLVIAALAVASCGSSVDLDEDNDGFYDQTEDYAGTDRLDACGDDRSDSAWPPDFNNDRSVTGSDLSHLEAVLGQRVPAAPARDDVIADGAITGADLSAVAGRIGTSCGP